MTPAGPAISDLDSCHNRIEMQAENAAVVESGAVVAAKQVHTIPGDLHQDGRSWLSTGPDVTHALPTQKSLPAFSRLLRVSGHTFLPKTALVDRAIDGSIVVSTRYLSNMFLCYCLVVKTRPGAEHYAKCD